MTPFRVEWRLATPMVSPTFPIHLDALLAWAVVDAAGGDWTCQDDLPLARAGAGDDWVWRASRVFPEVHWRSRYTRFRPVEPWSDGMDYGEVLEPKGGGSRKTGTGPYRAYMLQTDLIHVDRARAWGVGDLDAVRTLLERVTALGALRRLDHGRIHDFEVAEDPAAETLWPLRALPSRRDGYVPTVSRLRPPYFLRAQRQQVFEPTDSVIRAAFEAAEGARALP